MFLATTIFYRFCAKKEGGGRFGVGRNFQHVQNLLQLLERGYFVDRGFSSIFQPARSCSERLRSC